MAQHVHVMVHVPKDLEASSIGLNGKEVVDVTAFDAHETILDAVGIQTKSHRG